MAELTFYHANPSRGLVVHWLLEELGVEYELKLLQLEAQEHKTPDYLAINPMGKVPAIVHNGVVVTETAAICLYLSEAFAEAGLGVALDDADRGSFLRWLFFSPVTAEPSIITQAMGAGGGDAEYQPFADLSEVVHTVKLALDGRDYLVGQRFTAADVMMASTINWGLNLMPVLPKDPILLRYWELHSQRPAWQRVLAAG